MLAITTTSERIDHWTRMLRSLAKFSESEASNHTPSLADFTTTTPELKFSVHTPIPTLTPRLSQWLPRGRYSFFWTAGAPVKNPPAWAGERGKNNVFGAGCC